MGANLALKQFWLRREHTSARQLLRIRGALVAVPFYVKATGYKSRTAVGFRPKLQSETCAALLY